MKDKIREILTYHSKDGTSGYLLSEEKFEKLFEVIEEDKHITNQNWEEEFDKEFRVIGQINWEELDNGCVLYPEPEDLKDFITTLLANQRKETATQIDKYISNWLHDHANTPLDARKGTFDEVCDLRDGLIKELKL